MVALRLIAADRVATSLLTHGKLFPPSPSNSCKYCVSKYSINCISVTESFSGGHSQSCYGYPFQP